MNIFKQHYRQIIDGNVLLVILIAGLLALSSSAASAPSVSYPYMVRVIYMVPSNRSPQSGAQNQLIDYVLRMRAWYGEEMARMGYGNKNFIYETEADGVTPKINIVTVTEKDTFFQGAYLDRWGKILEAITAAGFPAWQRGEVLLVVADTHIQNPDGSMNGDFVGGTSGWFTDFTGVGVISGEFLARFPEASLKDDRPYKGSILLTIGPYLLVQDVTFPWFEGTTFSSVSSSAQGAALHELSHGFGLEHDFRNDENFNGNLMGNGLRGVRGALYPDLYPTDDMRLSGSAAMQLNYNRFFNAGRVFTEDNPPQVNILTQGNVAPVNGQCPVRFSASDTDSTLAGALLLKDGMVTADMRLSGKSITTTISTYDYVPGQTNQWSLQVFDTQGNVTLSSGVLLTCATGFNRAPQPTIRITKRRLKIGEAVVLDAGRSLDPDGNTSRMTVQWDLNGDGIFDTPASTRKTFTATYNTVGVYQISARLTDQRRSTSKSIPIGIRVE
ncbi:MAG: hypothetical protein HOP23_07940 [Methylococcaceae bacterium]|nr:hypothetical protein [Methylococcaceae bacterium]